MTLTTALESAKSGLSASLGQIAVVSRNVANAGDGVSSRKIVSSFAEGGVVRLSAIARASSEALAERLWSSTSDQAMSLEIAKALKSLSAIVGDSEDQQSPAALIGVLRDRIRSYAADPQDTARAQNTLTAAHDVVTALHDATQTIRDVRKKADDGIAFSVTTINTLLNRFSELNQLIVNGTLKGADVTDSLDQRDRILGDLAQEIGFQVIPRQNNDLLLTTDSGITLFDRVPRPVTFERTLSYAGDPVGQPVYIDGIAATVQGSVLAIHSGRLVGLTKVRDEEAITYQTQLDEVARSLIEAFSEKDQSPTPSLSDRPGLFTYTGFPAVPPSGVAIKGLATDIKISNAVDPAVGGTITRLRDGGISSAGLPPYVYNNGSASGFSQRLIQLVDAFEETRFFDANSQLGSSSSLLAFSSSSVGWVDQQRKSASETSDYSNTLQKRAVEALSRETGVNLDDEMTVLLALERSYQASAKLLSSVDSLYQTLFEAIR